MKQRWFEPYLQSLLLEAGKGGLRINNIVFNVCNMEPKLFNTPHTYEETWSAIYQFLRRESQKTDSPYGYVEGKRGFFCLDATKLSEDAQMNLQF